MSEKRLKGSIYKEAKESSGFLFWKTFNAWNRLLSSELTELDLTQAQYSILAATSYLGSSGTVSQQNVADQLSMDKMMVSDVTKTLEKKRFLNRKAHPGDGRATALELTSGGKALLKKAVPIVESVDEQFFGKLSATEAENFRSYLDCLIRLPV